MSATPTAQAANTPEETAPTGLSGRRIAVVATGAPGAAFLPSWLSWIDQVAPGAEVRVVVTRSALQFVGAGALRTFTGRDPIVDRWDHDCADPVHVELGQWAEGWLIHPASMHFVSRLAAGSCDSPALLAVQGTLARSSSQHPRHRDSSTPRCGSSTSRRSPPGRTSGCCRP